MCSNSLNAIRKDIIMTEKQLETKSSVSSSIPRINNDKSTQAEILKEAIFEIQKEPPMLMTLDLISSLDKNREIVLKAKGDSISNAVSVANIITDNLRERSNSWNRTVDAHGHNTQMHPDSTIEIALKITSP